MARGHRPTVTRIAGDDAAALLSAFKGVVRATVGERIENRPLLGCSRSVVAYLRLTMAGEPVEAVRILHLNIHNRLMLDEELSHGTVDTAPVYVREVARRVLEVGSSRIIIAHNHPSGDPQPSSQDVAVTRQIIAALRVLNVVVHDHIIVGIHGHTSFRVMGLI